MILRGESADLHYICIRIHIIVCEERMEFNGHNKQEFPPMHTAEHILNGTMVKMFGCGRAANAHIERKKSKCDYLLPAPLTGGQIAEVERWVNEVIGMNLPVTDEKMRKSETGGRFDLSRLPENASEMVRIVRVGDYDECLCLGAHVISTSEIGRFRISSARYADGVQRLVFRLDRDDLE